MDYSNETTVLERPKKAARAKPKTLQQPGAMPEQSITIPAPNMQTIELNIVGTASLMINKFSAKAINIMMDKQKAGSTGSKGKKRNPKDFDEAYENARHRSLEGWDGYPAGGLRQALISACGLVDFHMTVAKKCLFVLADGMDTTEGTPLVRVLGPEPERNIGYGRNATGVADIRIRPMWREWAMRLRIRYDADRFTQTDVVNLVHRAGEQCGIGEGRPNSKKSAGLGLGTFRLAE